MQPGRRWSHRHVNSDHQTANCCPSQQTTQCSPAVLSAQPLLASGTVYQSPFEQHHLPTPQDSSVLQQHRHRLTATIGSTSFQRNVSVAAPPSTMVRFPCAGPPRSNRSSTRSTPSAWRFELVLTYVTLRMLATNFLFTYLHVCCLI